jgi:flagellar biosynthesis regulator FlaF
MPASGAACHPYSLAEPCIDGVAMGRRIWVTLATDCGLRTLAMSS